MEYLLQFLLISLGMQVLFFVPAFVFKTDKFTDFSYGLTFIVLTGMALCLSGVNSWKWLIFGMVTLWGLRLIGYLLIRIAKMKKDKRFDEIRESLWKFGAFWLFQGIAAWVILIPTLYFIQGEVVFSNWLIVGGVIWLVGFLIETVADYQKFVFIQNFKNKGKWIQEGLWKYSRHPNYFGEIICWVGLYLFSFSSLTGPERWIGLVSPIGIAVILLFISGVPKLEEYADKKWGDNKAYQEYKKRTSLLLILPRKK